MKNNHIYHWRISLFMLLTFGMLFFFQCERPIQPTPSLKKTTLSTSEQQIIDSCTAKINRHTTNLDSIFHYTGQAQKIHAQQKDWIAYVTQFRHVMSCAGNLGQFDLMKTYIDTIKQTFEEKDLPLEHSEYIAALQWDFFYFFMEKRNYKKSIEPLEEALAILENKSSKGRTQMDSTQLFEISANRAVTYQLFGDYEKGIESGLRGLSFLPYFRRTHPYIGKAQMYNNIGLNYYGKRAYDEAISYYRKSLDIFAKTDTTDNVIFQYVPTLYNNIATAFSGNEQYDSALLYLNYELDTHYLKKQFNIQTIGSAYAQQRFDQHYHNIAYAYYGKKRYQKATEYILRSINLKMVDKEGQRLQTLPKHPKIGKNYNLLGKIQERQGLYKAALQSYKKAMVGVILPFQESDDIYELPMLSEILSEKSLLLSLKNTGHIFNQLYQQTNDLKDLTTAFESYQLAARLINQIRRGYKAEGSKQYFSETTLPIYENAIHTAVQLSQKSDKDTAYLEAAFGFAENSKAVSLLAAIKDAEAKQFAGVPPTLLEQESDLKIELAKNEQLYYNAKRNNRSVDVVEKYQQDWYEKSEEYDLFMARLEEDFPAYYKLKYDDKNASIQEIQDLLPDHQTAFLEYFVGDSTIFIFTITKKTANIRSIKRPIHLNTTIKAFRNALTNLEFIRSSLDSSFEIVTTTGHELYRQLVALALKDLKNIQQLIIVPDGILGHIPFEALVQSPPKPNDNFKTIAYLTHTYDIAYAYSGSLLHQLQTNPNQSRSLKAYAGFAADYPEQQAIAQTRDIVGNTREGIAALPHAAKEIQTVARLVNGRAFTKLAATETNFTRQAPNYQVLHLSMHGLLDDENPLLSHLLFSADKNSDTDGKLTVLDIYNFKLNAELVVLSACNTGFGETKRGEGVMSLSRAFAYAGCPSTVMSLWSVPDKSTSDIIIGFFKYLKQQTPKHKALRAAKLDYLKKSDNFLAHPVFWAGFVPMGDVHPIHFQSNRMIFWWYVLWGAILIVGLIFIKRLSKPY